MCIGCNWELLHDVLWLNMSLPEVTPHLMRCCSLWTVGRTQLDCMILSAVWTHMYDVFRYLAVLQLRSI
jgi:hypothetical protein